MQLFKNILSSFTLLFSRMNSIFPSLPSKAKGQRSSSTSSMSGLRSAASASDGPWFRNMRHWPVEAATSEAGHFPPLGNVTLNAHKICECVWNCMEVSVWPKWFCMTEMINYVCDCLCIPAGYSKRILRYSYSLKKLAKKLCFQMIPEMSSFLQSCISHDSTPWPLFLHHIHDTTGGRPKLALHPTKTRRLWSV